MVPDPEGLRHPDSTLIKVPERGFAQIRHR